MMTDTITVQAFRQDDAAQAATGHGDHAFIVFETIDEPSVVEACGEKRGTFIDEGAAVEGIVGQQVGWRRRKGRPGAVGFPEITNPAAGEMDVVVKEQHADGFLIIVGGHLIIGIEKSEKAAGGLPGAGVAGFGETLIGLVEDADLRVVVPTL